MEADGDSVSDGCVTTDDFPSLAIGESYRVTQGLVARRELGLTLDKSTRHRMGRPGLF